MSAQHGPTSLSLYTCDLRVITGVPSYSSCPHLLDGLLDRLRLHKLLEEDREEQLHQKEAAAEDDRGEEDARE